MLIPLKELYDKYNLNIKGVIHIGAYNAEEYPAYQEVGVPHTIWFEALPNLAYKLTERFKNDNTQDVYGIALSDKNEKVDFIVTNNEASSSLLELGTHLKHHPKIHEVVRIKVDARTWRWCVQELLIDISGYNFLNIDVQGAELKVLKGMVGYIDKIDYLYLEVNTEEVYKGCALLPELDEFLEDFERVETKMTRYNWGDAFWIRKTLL